MNTEELYKKARELGLTWTFNTQEGLEFAVSFFSSKLQNCNTDGHSFFYNENICSKCGVEKVRLMSLERKKRDAGCYAYKLLSERLGRDINELL